jgi:hypothetical protein
MVRQAHHERNQYIAIHPEPVEGFNSVSNTLLLKLNNETAALIRMNQILT